MRVLVALSAAALATAEVVAEATPRDARPEGTAAEAAAAESAWAESIQSFTNPAESGVAEAAPREPQLRGMAAELPALNRTTLLAQQVTLGAGAGEDYLHELEDTPPAALPSSRVMGVVSGLAAASNYAFHLSPLGAVRGFARARSTGRADAAPLVALMVTCIGWVFYGFISWLSSGEKLVLVTGNFLGMALGIYYNWTFATHCDSKEAREMFMWYLQVAAFLGFTELLALLMLPSDQAYAFIGLACSFMAVLTSSSLLVSVRQVFASRCAESMNLPMIAANLVSSFLWLLVAVFLWDPFLLATQTANTALSAFALSVKIYFDLLAPRALASLRQSLKTAPVEDQGLELTEVNYRDSLVFERAALEESSPRSYEQLVG